MALDANLSRARPRRALRRSLSTIRQASMRIPIVLALAAFALAACNASQEVNPSSRTAPGVAAGPNFPNYNPNNPISYGQTSGFYHGGR